MHDHFLVVCLLFQSSKEELRLLRKENMECNKDDAVRAKALAERKFIEKNYAISKKFALKAQNLYPELEGLSQMLTILDVYVAAENKINGEVDWYGILSVTPFADHEMIRKQYRKLALMLHPDKNKSLGAEGAFKLVSEAWSFLSDESKRLAYNHKRGFQHEVLSRTRGPSVQPSANTCQNVMNSATSNARAQRGPTLSPSYGNTATFWTFCNRCQTHYQYLRIYLNHILVCPNCQKTFMAIEQAPPPSVFKSSSTSSSQQHQNSRHHAAGGNSFSSGRNCTVPQNLGAGESLGPNSLNKTNFKQGFFSKMNGVGSPVASGQAAAPAVSAAQQASEKMKRDRERRQSIAEWERSKNLMGNPSLKKKRTDDKHLNGYQGGMANQMSKGSDGADLGGVSELSTGNVGTKRIYGLSSTYDRPNVARELPYPEMKKILIWKARTEICKMLNRQSSATKAEKVKVNKKQKTVVNVDTANKSGTGEEATPPVSINVPDPDFHNFDLDRTERSFGDDQVWAAYDDDGMPRYYARIHKVISLKPFKMRISWLNSRSNSELGPMDWVGSGFTKTCGDFRAGRHEIYDTLNSFSNKVSWTKSTRGVIRIFPTRSEVWALYTNWSPDWNQHTPDAVIHKYDMVEVLDDFAEERGVCVVPLCKVAGFKTVFRKHMDPKEVRWIPKEEMFRFSHQVPSHLLTGEEAPNAPKGCWELDPAATPSELLQVITEADEAPMAENGGKTKGGIFQSASAREVDGGMEKEMFQEVVHTKLAKETNAITHQ
ncbi:unnamed protein product [Prunus armeniaca]